MSDAPMQEAPGIPHPAPSGATPTAGATSPGGATATGADPSARPSIPTLALVRVLLRSLFLQAAWNPPGMQDLGFCWAMGPALKALYPDRATRAKAALRHLEFFNCHPYLAAAILGAAANLEEQVARGERPPEAVSQLKRALGPPFAAVGDGFFWLALRPAAALVAALTMPWLGLWSVLLFLVLYNAFHLCGRAWLFFEGYQLGPGVVAAVARAKVPSMTGMLKLSAAAMAGVLVARAVLVAAAPARPFHALLVAGATLFFVALLPRARFAVALYSALLLGLAIGGTFF
jgi:mannose PTS system EIID component